MLVSPKLAYSLLAVFCLSPFQPSAAQVPAPEAVAYFDFGSGTEDRSPNKRVLRIHGAQWHDIGEASRYFGKPGDRSPAVIDTLQSHHGPALEFTGGRQYAEFDLSGALDGARSVTVGGWFYTRRSGEQLFFSRGTPLIEPLGEVQFRPEPDWVNFMLGTDPRGFLTATIHGSGNIRFPYVTINEVPINTWNQLVAVKDAAGFQKFYQNGVLVRTDRDSMYAGRIRPFNDRAAGETARLAVPLGGLIGEAWIFAREITADEMRQDYLAKKDRYDPAPPGEVVLLREVNMHPAAGQWKEPPDRERWPEMRKRILEGAMKIAGAFPSEKAPLDPKVISEEDCGTYIRRKVSIQVQPEDRMPAWMLIPKKRPGRLPVVICMYGTTQGAGKDSTVGLSGYKRGTPPNPNWSFALDMVEAGFVAWAPDYLRDGERVKPGQRPYDTSDFHSRFPDWTIMGKDVWDNMRAIDYFETLDFIDSKRIGVVGHSYGAGNTINTAALERRVTAAVANGPLSHFRYYRRSGRRSVPIHYYELESLIAPRALLVGQAVGEQRPLEEENYAAVREVYRALGHPDRVRFHWYAGDHDFPPEARKAAVEWFGRWFGTLR